MLRRLLDTLFARTKPPTSPPRLTDHLGDREAQRAGQMSPEDQTWEAASQQRNRDNQARDQANRQPPE